MTALFIQNVSYGSGSFSGTECTHFSPYASPVQILTQACIDVDQVTIAPDLVIQQQSIGVATQATGFSGVDGILGVGPTDLTQGTVSNTTTVPTVTDNLFSQGTISTEVLAISFEPSTTSDPANGELTFGGTDSTK